MAGNPLRHPMQTIINIFIGIIAFVVVFNIAAAAIQPYMHWIGLTVTVFLIAGIIGGSAAGIVAIVRYIGNRDGSDHFNG